MMWKASREPGSRPQPQERGGQTDARRNYTGIARRQEANRPSFIIVIMTLVLWGVCCWLLNMTDPYLHPQLVLNQIAPGTLYARTDFSFEDKAETDAAQNAVKQSQIYYWRCSETYPDKVMQNVDALFAAVVQREKTNQFDAVPNEELQQAVKALSPMAFQRISFVSQEPIQTDLFKDIIQNDLERGFLNSSDWQGVPPDAQVCIIDTEGRELRPRDLAKIATLDRVVEKLTDFVVRSQSEGSINKNERDQIANLLRTMFQNTGNLVPDKELTAARLQGALRNVQNFKIEVKRGDKLIVRGDKVTEKDLVKLEAHDAALNAEQADLSRCWQKRLSSGLWSLLFILFAGFYFRQVHPEVAKNSRNMALTVLVTILAVICNYGGLKAFYYASATLGIPPGLVVDAMPLALASVLLTVIVGYRVALYAGFFVTMIGAMMQGGSFPVALEGLALSALCGMLVRNSYNYRSFFLRIFTSVLLMMLLLDFSLLEHVGESSRILGYALLLVFANALFTALAALLLTFIFEVGFNVNTDMSLMVLCDFNHPLLKELQLRAPGTSQHSQNVAMLAEAAAAEIGANAVRARAGALFHDVGKLKNPEYFIENNLVGPNPHDKLPPRKSSFIISNHVKDGMELARQYNLCRVVRDAIAQHHGTDLIQYFYHKALQSKETVKESDYRYPGPRPASKETVIVSLADACEAACRSLGKPTAEQIKGMVDDIFRKRWRDGQLDEAEVSAKELTMINESFVRTLISMHHSRIAYPKDENPR